MKKLRLPLLVALLLGVIAFSCKPDGVQPVQNEETGITLATSADTHAIPTPQCSQKLSVSLISTTNGAFWGGVEMANTPLFFVVSMVGFLPIVEAALWHGPQGTTPPITAGEVDISQFQYHAVINPASAQWSFKVPLGNLQPCNEIVLWAKVAFVLPGGDVLFSDITMAFGKPIAGAPGFSNTFCLSMALCPGECELWQNATNPCVAAPPASCCDCDKKTGMKSLTVTYVGPSGVSIHGISNGESLGSWTNVQDGDHLFLDASNHTIGKFKNNISVFVDGTEYNIHTSCSQVIVGETVGPLTNIRHEDNSGNICEAGSIPCSELPCCDCDKSTGMKSLTVTYVGPSGVDINGISNGESLGSWQNVQDGDHLFLDASNHSIGKFKNNISVFVDGTEYNIHTSCSQVIVGETVGPLTNIRHEDNSGNICEDGAMPCLNSGKGSKSNKANKSSKGNKSTKSSKKSTKSSKKSTKSSKKSTKSSKKTKSTKKSKKTKTTKTTKSGKNG